MNADIGDDWQKIFFNADDVHDANEQPLSEAEMIRFVELFILKRKKVKIIIRIRPEQLEGDLALLNKAYQTALFKTVHNRP